MALGGLLRLRRSLQDNIMIERNITRTIKNTTETTKETFSITSDPLLFVLTTSDFFYVGFQDRFSTRYFDLSVVNSNSFTLTIEQWDGSTWVAVEDIVDQTVGFTKSGFISWVNGDIWEKVAQAPIDDVELFWVRMSVSADLSASTALQTCINLFSDDAELRIHYPDLITDSRYLPDSRTNFLEQHLAAKNYVVQRLKQSNEIRSEGEIIDINPVMMAAIHRVAWTILNPIAMDDETKDLAARALELFSNELSSINLNLDSDRDGKVDENERLARFVGGLRRG